MAPVHRVSRQVGAFRWHWHRAFYLYFMPEVDKQKARGGQLRLNYVIERQDGTAVLLHPGTRPCNDAKPILLSARELQLKLGYE